MLRPLPLVGGPLPERFPPAEDPVSLQVHPPCAPGGSGFRSGLSGSSGGNLAGRASISLPAQLGTSRTALRGSRRLTGPLAAERPAGWGGDVTSVPSSARGSEDRPPPCASRLRVCTGLARGPRF